MNYKNLHDINTFSCSDNEIYLKYMIECDALHDLISHIALCCNRGQRNSRYA